MEISDLLEVTRSIRTVRRILFALSLFITLYSSATYANRVGDKIYSNLQSNHFCSRRLNTTHQVGCSSELGGNLGVVWLVEEEADLNHILKTGLTPPYTVILRREFYTRSNLLVFKENLDRVSGVVFLEKEDLKNRPSLFSPDDRCPNRHSGLYVNDTEYGDCKKNYWQKESPISGILYEDIPYPIFYINDKKSIEEIETCFSQNNLKKGNKKEQDTYPLCGMQLDSFMLAASDTERCLNSRSLVDDFLQTNGMRCATVENQNIFAFYKPTHGEPKPIGNSSYYKPAVVQPQSIVLLVAKLSSLSMFTDLSPGADSTVTAIVTILAAAEALGRIRNNPEVANSDRNIAFALLDSEPFDYTGSSRMVYSMMNNSFPNKYFKLPNITETMRNVMLPSLDYIINLDQLANYPNSNGIHLHTDPNTSNDAKYNKVLEIFKRLAVSEKVDFKVDDPKLPLPPAPVHEFIRQSRNLSTDNQPFGLVISNYGETYNNLLYNSIYDDPRNVFQTSKESLVEHISQVASFIAKSAFELAFKSKETKQISIDKGIVEDLLECYMIDADCNLFTRAWQAGQQLPNGPIQTYNDPTKRSDDMNGAITTHLLAFFLGDKLPEEYNITKCYEENTNSLIYNYQYVNGNNEPVKNGRSGVCVRSQVLTTMATSPAFEVTMDGILVDPKYPAWTVSLNSIRNPVRLYLKPSPIHEWSIFLIGLVVTIMSFFLVHQIKGSIEKVQAEIIVQTGTST